MDVLLVDPPYRTLKNMPTDIGYNLGITSLAAYLRQGGIETGVVTGELLKDLKCTNKYFSMNFKKYAAGQQEYETVVGDKTNIIWQKVADIVRQTRPIAVGIQYFTPLRCVVERMASTIKEVDRDIKVITGSYHPTFCPDEVMQNPDIDFVIRGEGEIPLLNLVKELKAANPKFEDIPGICYRDGQGQVRSNPVGAYIANLDELPFPARDLVLNADYNVYRAHSIATARGCPYSCTFCSDRRLWGGKVRRRSLDNVMQELVQLKANYRINYVEILDGTFTFDREYVRQFCNAIIDRKLGLEWKCTARYDNLDEELLKLMKKANCTGLYLGFESGSERILKDIDKKTNLQENIRLSHLIYKSGIPSATAIMFGLPDENKEDIEKTLEALKQIRTDIFDINSYIPLPGTPLYDAMSEEEKNGIDWLKIGLKSFDNYFCKGVSHDELKHYLSEAYKIADSVRIKTLARFAVKKLFQIPANLFRQN